MQRIYNMHVILTNVIHFFQNTVVPLLYAHSFCIEKEGLIRGGGGDSLDEDNLVVFYYLSASEIWAEKRGGL